MWKREEEAEKEGNTFSFFPVENPLGYPRISAVFFGEKVVHKELSTIHRILFTIFR